MLKSSLFVAAGIGLYTLLGAQGTDGASTGILHAASVAVRDNGGSPISVAAPAEPAPLAVDARPDPTPCGTATGVEWFCDVPYAPDPAGVRLMDIYKPTGSTPTRTILWVHGGGWDSGSKSDNADLLKKLATAPLHGGYGYAVASMDYTLAAEGQPSFPRCIQDVLQAISELRSDIGAEYGLPPCIVVVGISAGAHLASVAATGWDVDYFHPANTTGAPCFDTGLPADSMFLPDLVVTVSGTTNLYALGANGYSYHASCTGRDDPGVAEDTCHECSGIQEHFDVEEGYPDLPGAPGQLTPPELLVGISWTAGMGLILCGSFTIPSNLFRRASAHPWISSGDPPYHAFNALCDAAAFSLNPVTLENTFAVALDAATGTATWEIIGDDPGEFCKGCRHALSILGTDVNSVAGVLATRIDERFQALDLCGER
jgi:hypothetical protein